MQMYMDIQQVIPVYPACSLMTFEMTLFYIQPKSSLMLSSSVRL